MSDPKIVPMPDRNPEPVFGPDELVFTSDELERIAGYKAQYETPEGAVMKTFWLAQEKFGFLPPEVIRLVASTLGIPYAHAYGVATFYTQYFKEPVGRHVLDVCTCFSCQVVGGYDMLHYLEEKLGVHEGGTSDDGMFTLRQAECLGACGSGPMLQVTNGPYVFNLTEERIDKLIDELRAGNMPGFVSVTLPQDEAELGGNRRSDTTEVARYETPTPAKSLS